MAEQDFGLQQTCCCDYHALDFVESVQMGSSIEMETVPWKEFVLVKGCVELLADIQCLRQGQSNIPFCI